MAARIVRDSSPPTRSSRSSASSGPPSRDLEPSIDRIGMTATIRPNGSAATGVTDIAGSGALPGSRGLSGLPIREPVIHRPTPAGASTRAPAARAPTRDSSSVMTVGATTAASPISATAGASSESASSMTNQSTHVRYSRAGPSALNSWPSDVEHPVRGALQGPAGDDRARRRRPGRPVRARPRCVRPCRARRGSARSRPSDWTGRPRSGRRRRAPPRPPA